MKASLKRAHQRNTATNEFDVDKEEVEGQVRFVATDDHDHDDDDDDDDDTQGQEAAEQVWFVDPMLKRSQQTDAGWGGERGETWFSLRDQQIEEQFNIVETVKIDSIIQPQSLLLIGSILWLKFLTRSFSQVKFVTT